MPAPKKNPLTNLIKKGAKRAVVKVKPKPNLKANPKSNVKVNTTPWSTDEVKEFQGSYNKAIASGLKRRKSGATARYFAQGVRELNKTAKKSKTIKIKGK